MEKNALCISTFFLYIEEKENINLENCTAKQRAYKNQIKVIASQAHTHEDALRTFFPCVHPIFCVICFVNRFFFPFLFPSYFAVKRVILFKGLLNINIKFNNPSDIFSILFIAYL